MSEPAAKLQVERLARGAARLVAELRRRATAEGEVWRTLERRVAHKCKALWSHLRTMTLEKFFRLLQAGEAGEQLEAPARMSPADWLLLDLLLVHDANLALVQPVSLRSPAGLRPLVQLFHLAQLFHVEECRRERLAHAWASAALHYNKLGTQCTPMVLQRRWWELKSSTRECFYRYFARTSAGSHDMPEAGAALSGDERPAHIHVSIARRYPEIITKPLPSWQQLVAEGGVALPQEFDEIARRALRRPGEGKALPEEKEAALQVEEEEPDLILVEPPIETIEVKDEEEKEVPAELLSDESDPRQVSAPHGTEIGVALPEIKDVFSLSGWPSPSPPAPVPSPPPPLPPISAAVKSEPSEEVPCGALVDSLRVQVAREGRPHPTAAACPTIPSAACALAQAEPGGAVVSRQPEDPDTEELKAIFDEKLLLIPSVDTTRLEQMYSLRGFDLSCTLSLNAELLQAVLAESRAEQTSDCGVFRGWPAQPCDADSATRSLDLLAMMRQVEQLKKGLQVQQESEGADDAEIKQEDEDELNDVEYVPTHKAINRPAGRAYTPIALCKNPDFNTRLRRLSAGFLMLASNREYLKMCKPLTIDIISKCDAHLQPQQATRLNPPAATAAGGLLTMDITGESDEEPARTQSTALCDAVERLPGMVPPSVSAPGTAGAAAACTSADCVVIELPQTVRDAVRATTEIPVFVKSERDRPGPMRFKLSASEEPNVGWERPGPRRYKKNYTGGEGSSGDCRERGVSLEVEQGREPGEGCGRKSKPIELPDIQELRRVNRHMLTAEVSPVQARVSPFRRPDYRLQLTRSGEVVISGRAQKLRIPPVPVSRVPRAAGAGGGRGPQAAGAAAQPGWRAGARPDDQPLITSDTFYKILDSLTFNQRHLHQPGAAAAAAATAVAGAAAVAGAGEGAAAAAEASEGSSKPKGKYCCSARRHRVINDARRRMQLKRPKSSVKLELGIHRHTRELCKCCCKHLHWPSTPEPDQEATPEKELVRRAEQLVDREISEVLSVQPTTDSAAVAVAIETDQTEPQELQQLDAITQQTISTPVNMKPGIISADTSQREPIIAIDTAPSATHSRAPASSDEEAELVINLELEDTGEKKQPVDEPDKENHLKKLEMEIEELKKIINTKRIKRKYTKSSSLSENQKQQRYTEARRKRYQDLLQARREENEKMDKEVQRLQKTLDLRFGVKQKSELQRESVSPLAPMTSALVDNDAVIDLDVEEDLEAQQLDPMKQDRLNQLDKQVTELKAMISQKKAEEDAKERRQVFYRKRAQKKATQKKVAQRRSQKKREEDTYKSEYELWLEEKRQAEKFGFKVKTTAYNPRVLPKRQSARPTPLPPRNMSYDTNAPVAHVQVDFKSNSINISVDAVEAAPTAPQSVLPPPPLVDFEGTILDAAESYILRLDEGVTPNQFASYKLLVTTANIDFGSGKETFWTLAKCGRPSIQLDLNYLETAAGDSADINTDVTSSEETSASTSAAQSTSGNKNCSGIFQQFSEEKTKISEHSVVDLVDVEPRDEARRDSTDSESNLVIVEDLPAKQVMNEQQQTQAQNEYPQELTDPCKMSVISFNKKFSTQIMIESSPEGSPVPELTEEEAPSPLDGDNTPADENVRGPPLQSDKPPVPQSLLTTYSTNPQLQTYSKPAAAGVLHPNVLISNNMRYQKISSDPLLYIQVLTPIKNVSLVNRVRDMGGELLVYHVLTGSLIPMPKAVSSFTPLGVLTHIETSESQLSQSMSVTVTGDESDANVNDCPPLSNNAINVPVFVKTAPKQNRNKRQTAVELDSNSDSDEEYRPPAYVKRKISSQDLVPVQVRSSPLKTRSLLKQTTATVSKALQPVSNSRSLLKSDLLSPENLKSATDSSRMLEEHCYTRVPEEPVWEVVAEEAPPAGDECILGM